MTVTRINLIDPSVLTNKHLHAEYRELPRIFTAVRKLIADGQTPADVTGQPHRYVLGTGHVKFFYTRVGWLIDRYFALFEELRSERGYDLDVDMFRAISDAAAAIPAEWRQDYQPTPEEIYLNMARIAKRSNLPHVLDELAA